MKPMRWVAVLLVLACGHAVAVSLQTHREMRDDYWVPMVNRGVPASYLNSSSAEWARNVDFASASSVPRTNWSPALERADFGGLPPPMLTLPSEDPLGPLPPSGNPGAALAGNMAAEDRLGQLTEVLAVPEPSALLMMLAGLGAIAFVIRRRINDS